MHFTLTLKKKSTVKSLSDHTLWLTVKPWHCKNPNADKGSYYCTGSVSSSWQHTTHSLSTEPASVVWTGRRLPPLQQSKGKLPTHLVRLKNHATPGTLQVVTWPGPEQIDRGIGKEHIGHVQGSSSTSMSAHSVHQRRQTQHKYHTRSSIKNSSHHPRLENESQSQQEAPVPPGRSPSQASAQT